MTFAHRRRSPFEPIFALHKASLRTHRTKRSLTLAEVSYQPRNPYSLEKFSSLGSLGHKLWRRWSHLLANRTAGTGFPLLRATWWSQKRDMKKYNEIYCLGIDIVWKISRWSGHNIKILLQVTYTLQVINSVGRRTLSVCELYIPLYSMRAGFYLISLSSAVYANSTLLSETAKCFGNNAYLTWRVSPR